MRYFGIKMHNFLRFGETDNSIVFDLTGDQQKKVNSGEVSLDHLYEELRTSTEAYVTKAKTNEDDNIMSGIVGITGMTSGSFDASNGAGKSTVFEAMAYASYGRIVRQTANTDKIGNAGMSVITKLDGKYPDTMTESYVESFFEEDGHIYRVKRGRKFTKGGKPGSAILEFEQCDHEDGKLGGHKKDDTKDSIEQVIVEDYDIFVNSVMFGQNDAGKFLMGADKTKKEMIITLLKLEDVVKGCIEVTRSHKKEQTEKVNTIKSRIENLQELVLKEYRNRTVEEDSEYQDSTIDDVVSLITSEIVVSRDELEHIKKSEESLSKEIKELENSEVIQKIKSLTEEGKKSVLLKKEKEAKKNEEIVDWTRLRQESQTKHELANTETLKHISEISEIEIRKRQHSEIVKSFDEKDVNEKLEKCKKAIALKEKYETMQIDVNKKREEQNIKLMAFNAAINAKVLEVSKLEKQIEEMGDSGKFLCTECKSLVTKEHVLKKIEDHNKVISENRELMKPVKAHFDKIAEAKESVENRLKQIAQYSIEEGKYNLSLSEYKSAKDNLGHYDETIKSRGEQKEKVAKEIEEIKSKLKEYSDKCESIEENYQKEVSTLDLTIKQLREEVVALRQDASAIENKITETKDVLKKVHSDREELNKAIGSFQKEIESIIELGKRIADESKAHKVQSRQLRRYVILEKAFGLDGVQTRIVQKYLPLLNMYIKEYLDILSDGKMSIKMVINDKSKVDMIISGGTADTYSMLSGGEKMIVRLAVDIGLALLSFSRTAKKPDMICLDEIFGPLDKRHTSAVFRMLRELKNRFSRVFLISHKSDIQSLVKNNVVIEKSVGNHGLSKITGIHEISV